MRREFRLDRADFAVPQNLQPDAAGAAQVESRLILGEGRPALVDEQIPGVLDVMLRPGGAGEAPIVLDGGGVQGVERDAMSLHLLRRPGPDEAPKPGNCTGQVTPAEGEGPGRVAQPRDGKSGGEGKR